MLSLQQLFEKLNQKIDKPIEYNHLLTSAIQELFDLITSSQIQWQDGVPYLQDPLRSKLISVPRPCFTASWPGLGVTNRYLRTDGVTTSSECGIFIPRDAVITGLWAKSRSVGNWIFEIRRNGIPITLASIPVNSGEGYDDTVDINVNQGDFLQFYLSGVNVDHPIGVVELAWRA